MVAHYPLKGGNLRRRGSRRSAFLRKGRSGGGKKTVLLLSPSAGRGRFKKEGKFAGVRAQVTVACPPGVRPPGRTEVDTSEACPPNLRKGADHVRPPRRRPQAHGAGHQARPG